MCLSLRLWSIKEESACDLRAVVPLSADSESSMAIKYNESTGGSAVGK